MQQLGLSQERLSLAIATVRERISREYLERFPSTHTVLLVQNPKENRIRLLHIRRLTYSDEGIGPRLVSVYQAVSLLAETCFLLIQSDGESTELYLGVRSPSPSAAIDVLKGSLTGNFPGVVAELVNEESRLHLMDQIPEPKGGYAPQSVALLSVVPAPRQGEDRRDQEDAQGLEKFIDAMEGKQYTAILLASPYGRGEIEARISGLESIAGGLSAMEEITVQRSSSQASAVSDSVADTLSDTIGTSLSYGYSSAYTSTDFQQQARTTGRSFNPFLFGFSSGSQAGYGSSRGVTSGSQENLQSSLGFQHGVTRTGGVVLTQTEGETVSQVVRNVGVTNLIQQIQTQIQRLREGTSYGLWDCCGYFIAPTPDVALAAAAQFKGVVTGRNTYLDQSVLSLWKPERFPDGSNNYASILALIRTLKSGIAPRFAPRDRDDISYVTDSVVTGAELPYLLNLPKRSAGGVTVLRMAPFGRSIHLFDPDRAGQEERLPLGHIRHMGTDSSAQVELTLSHLSAHTAVFGAAGSGKSTAVCGILEALYNRDIPFTIIEPAKGDYSDIWRNLPGIRLYSTSPRRYHMLRLNPFAFREEVHVLNHIERLISVFQVCWPLYAAQAAILRDCVNQAYVGQGWDLANSIYLGEGEVRFPTFQDVLDILPAVIKESRLVGEARGTYEGALYTRLSMLTGGLFGQLLNNRRDIPTEDLFDVFAVIDLSELGSPEVQALMVGTLLVRLYEYRMSQGESPLRHVTVLEEAHNIFPRNPVGTGTEEGSSSVVSKSVEVLTKCIAELRFTGEGFLVVDQSPNAVDATAIKNTAAKIVLRLNSQDDQAAAAAALSLDGPQQNELSRLSVGTAVVMQDGWAEPIMTRISDYSKLWYGGGKTQIPMEEIGQIRSILAARIVEDFDLGRYDREGLYGVLEGYDGLNRWKKEEYATLFRDYDRQYAQQKSGFHLRQISSHFFGSLLREVLECDGLFTACPLPRPDKSSAPPFSEDPSYRARCRSWREKAIRALGHYAPALSPPLADRVLHLLLFDQAGRRSGWFAVIAALYQKPDNRTTPQNETEGGSEP